MKKALTVSIILRFPTANSVRLVASIERSLDAAEDISQIALNWNYPLHTLFSDSSSRAESVINRLKERGADRQIPMGFSGAYHGLLSPEELKKELEWALKNPWGEDMKTNFRLDPDAIFPSSVDLVRPALRRLYTGHPPLLVEDRNGESLYFGDAGGFNAVPSIDATFLDPKMLSKCLLRYYRKEPCTSVVVVVDAVRLDAEETSALLAGLTALAESKPSFEVAPIGSLLAQLAERASRIDADMVVPRIRAIPTDPVSRLSRSSVVELKKGRRRGADDLTRRRLERLTLLDIEESKG
ncbi:MAG TPA: hypothetical protein VMW69_13030, partial [Spirochaetia bacterium]|nr:hypothetical protein [Spirochaetia bacterium]